MKFRLAPGHARHVLARPLSSGLKIIESGTLYETDNLDDQRRIAASNILEIVQEKPVSAPKQEDEAPKAPEKAATSKKEGNK